MKTSSYENHCYKMLSYLDMFLNLRNQNIEFICHVLNNWAKDVINKNKANRKQDANHDILGYLWSFNEVPSMICWWSTFVKKIQIFDFSTIYAIWSTVSWHFEHSICLCKRIKYSFEVNVNTCLISNLRIDKIFISIYQNIMIKKCFNI
jgi:hypothetical protein